MLVLALNEDSIKRLRLQKIMKILYARIEIYEMIHKLFWTADEGMKVNMIIAVKCAAYSVTFAGLKSVDQMYPSDTSRNPF